ILRLNLDKKSFRKLKRRSNHMATYTMPLKAIIEQPTHNRNDLTLKQRLEVGRVNLFKDIDYPIFNENYRSEFETKFIRYFYNKRLVLKQNHCLSLNLKHGYKSICLITINYLKVSYLNMTL